MWNKASDRLLTASDNAKIFNVYTGDCVKDFKGNSGRISSALWVDNDTKILTAEVEKCMKLWSVDGTLLHTWKDFWYIDVVWSRENNLVCFHAGSNKIKVLDLDSKQIVISLEEDEKIRSISMSSDGKFLLTNWSEVNPAINLWSLDQK
jgi:WD repeat-containing protein 26